MSINPAPIESLEAKWIWFYKPYNFQANMQKHMHFEDDRQEFAAGYLTPKKEIPIYYPKIPGPSSPWNLERVERQEANEEYVNDMQNKRKICYHWDKCFMFMQKLFDNIPEK